VVPGANTGDEFGDELAAIDSRGASRIQQHIGDAGCGRDDGGPWSRLGLDDGGDLVNACRVSDRGAPELHDDHLARPFPLIPRHTKRRERSRSRLPIRPVGVCDP
jgi:hypothetical protein